MFETLKSTAAQFRAEHPVAVSVVKSTASVAATAFATVAIVKTAEKINVNRTPTE